MTNSMNYNYPMPANYSGVTINITNPAVNIPNERLQNQNFCTVPDINANKQNPAYLLPAQNNSQVYNNYPQAEYNASNMPQNTALYPQNGIQDNVYSAVPAYAQQMQNPAGIQQIPNQAYPSNYYLNNYSQVQNPNMNDVPNSNVNYQTAPQSAPQAVPQAAPQTTAPQAVPQGVQQASNSGEQNNSLLSSNPPLSQDMNTSAAIISEIDARNAEQKELEKTGTKAKITALTNEYIMSLENYLNNPNLDIRIMASKEILNRLDEDRSRYDDAALNALLNKMLQDPSKLVRIAALSAFSSELASGNDYTVELLQKIQQNPEADPEDVLEASQILLKRSSETEVRYVPVKNNVPTQEKVEK